MNPSVAIPHRSAHGLCIVNGIRDLVHWRSGIDWSNEFVYGLGLGSGFAYIRTKQARPPRQVYWGSATPKQHKYLAQLLGAEHKVTEDRTFEFAWQKACRHVDAGTMPILGPLDMFYLPYYGHIYHQRHIPLHYVLLVGYSELGALVHDTDAEGVQVIPLRELEGAWNVCVPAMGKKNRLVTFDLPEKLQPEAELIRQSITEKCRIMLEPPVAMFGVPGIMRLARDIIRWNNQLGAVTATACSKQMQEYLNSPPDISGNHLTGTRDLYMRFLLEASPIVGLDFGSPISYLKKSMGLIPGLVSALEDGRTEEVADHLSRIAEAELKTYTILRNLVS